MTAKHSKRTPQSVKPAKPFSGFPLFPHATGKWAKKIKGKMVYFGRWNDPQAALEEFQNFIAGRTQVAADDGQSMTLADAVNFFLSDRKASTASGELSERSFADYKSTCRELVKFFGADQLVSSLRPPNFGDYRRKLTETKNVQSLNNEISRVRTVFKWLSENEHIVKLPSYGREFDLPGKAVLRRHRQGAGSKLLTRDQLRAVLDECGIHLKAMTLMGISAGLGPTDIVQLPIDALELIDGWCDYPRPKTSIERRFPLWPEVVEAIRESMERRPEATTAAADGKQETFAECEGLLFVAPDGGPWKVSGSLHSVTDSFTAILKRIGIYRSGTSFKMLRATFATKAAEVGDDAALRRIMGHELGSVLHSNYVDQMPPERLQKVSGHVRSWLFGPHAKG